MFLLHGRVCQTLFRTQRKATDVFWQSKAGKSYIFLASLKSARYSRPVTEHECPNVAEEFWVIVQTAFLLLGNIKSFWGL